MCVLPVIRWKTLSIRIRTFCWWNPHLDWLSSMGPVSAPFEKQGWLPISTVLMWHCRALRIGRGMEGMGEGRFWTMRAIYRISSIMMCYGSDCHPWASEYRRWDEVRWIDWIDEYFTQRYVSVSSALFCESYELRGCLESLSSSHSPFSLSGVGAETEWGRTWACWALVAPWTTGTYWLPLVWPLEGPSWRWPV